MGFHGLVFGGWDALQNNAQCIVLIVFSKIKLTELPPKLPPDKIKAQVFLTWAFIQNGWVTQ